MRLINADIIEIRLKQAIDIMKLAIKSSGIDNDDFINGELKAYADILDGIEEQPTTSIEKIGKWTKNKFGDNKVRCSECGTILDGDDLKYRNDCYCYHCGAKMINALDDLEDNNKKKWIPIHGVCTPGGDPYYECPDCGWGRCYGVEHPDPMPDSCPNCGIKIEGFER